MTEIQIKNLKKDYVGDGIYVSSDQYMTMITTENGFRADNLIYVEPQFIKPLIRALLKHSRVSIDELQT